MIAHEHLIDCFFQDCTKVLGLRRIVEVMIMHFYSLFLSRLYCGLNKAKSDIQCTIISCVIEFPGIVNTRTSDARKME